MRVVGLVLVGLLWAMPVYANHSTLHTAATNLAAGSWVEFTGATAIGNLVTALGNTGGNSGYIFGYTDKWVWDTIGHAGYFAGMDHGSTCPRFVKYDEATHAMVVLPLTGFLASKACATPALHGYHHNAIDVIGRKLYHRPYNSLTTHSYDLTTAGPWTALTAIGSGTGASQSEQTNITAGVDFLPWMGTTGWLMQHSSEDGTLNTLMRWDPNASSWDTPTGWNKTMTAGPYHTVLECAVVSRTCMMGGGNGSSAVWRITPRETFTTGTAAAQNYGIDASITTHDPVTGKFLVLWGSSNWREYDAVANTWAVIGGTASVLSPPNSIGGSPWHGIVAAPLYDYGVIFFLKCSGPSTCTGWLYKHTASDEATRNFMAERCLRPGVRLCQGFDTSADLTGSTRASVSRLDTGTVSPVRDTAIKASGTGSLKLTVPTNSGANSGGSWHDNFRDNMTGQVGASGDVWMSWRQRFNCDFLFTSCPAATGPRSYQLTGGSGGWKLLITGTGDVTGTPAFSCTALETVAQSSGQRHFLQMYNSCTGSASHGPFNPFEQAFASQFSGSDFKLQNARPSPFCLYSQLPNVHVGNGCFPWYANEWLSFKMRITTGARTNGEFVNSHVDLFIARDGDTSWTQLFDWGPYNLTAPGTESYGKVWLLSYHTNKSSAEAHPEGNIWYDDLIVSTQDIAVPGVAASGGLDVTPPAAPTGVIISRLFGHQESVWP